MINRLIKGKEVVNINKPIRVLHIVRKMDIGGVQMMLMNYYRNIDRNLVQFDFVVQGEASGYFDDEIVSLGGNIYHVSSIKELPEYYFELYKLLKNNQFDIVHVHHNYANFHGLLIAFFAGVKVRISHSHNTPPENRIIKKVIKRVLRVFINLISTNRFACSKVAFEWLYGSKFKIGNSNDYIINNAIDVSKFMFDEHTREVVRSELDISNDIVIGHIGSFSDQKNHRFIIKIFTEIQRINSNSSLLLVGDGPLKEHIKNEIDKLGLRKKVKFMGNRNDVNKLLQAFDVFIFPSLYEGLGIVLVEAQSSGVICIASDTITKEVALTDLVSYKSLSDDPKEWAEQIINSVNLKKRIDRSSEIRKNGYDILQESKRLEDIYQYLKLGASK